jgi:hypothetical protein
MISDLQDQPSLGKNQPRVSNRTQLICLLPCTNSTVFRTCFLKPQNKKIKECLHYNIQFFHLRLGRKLWTRLACELGRSFTHCLVEPGITCTICCRHDPRIYTYVDVYGQSVVLQMLPKPCVMVQWLRNILKQNDTRYCERCDILLFGQHSLSCCRYKE